MVGILYLYKHRSLSIDWTLSESGTYHFRHGRGDFLERLVRSTKILLRRELGNLKLNYEQSQTVLLEIETILNNRPLTYYYIDKNEPCFNAEPYVIWTSICDPETNSDAWKILLPNKINNISIISETVGRKST